MRIGIILTAGSARADVELALRAEAAGFDGVYTIEFFNRNGYVPLGAIAQATSRVRIGTAIANAFTRSRSCTRPPRWTSTSSRAAGIVLGLGSATRRMNEDWYGVPFSAPAPRMRELVELLRAAFDAQKGGGFRWEGEHWKLSVPIYARPGRAARRHPDLDRRGEPRDDRGRGRRGRRAGRPPDRDAALAPRGDAAGPARGRARGGPRARAPARSRPT